MIFAQDVMSDPEGVAAIEAHISNEVIWDWKRTECNKIFGWVLQIGRPEKTGEDNDGVLSGAAA